MNQQIINEFFESHPAVGVVYEALGSLFLEEPKAKSHVAGTGQKYVKHEREGDAFFDHELTDEDLINNPELVEEGLQAGEVIQVPVNATAEEEADEEPEPEAVTELKPELAQVQPFAVTYADDEEIKERAAEKKKAAAKAKAVAKKKAEKAKAKTAPKK